MEKNFGNFQYKFFNYTIFAIIIFFSNNNYFINENLLLLLFLYSKDIIFTNPYLNNLFIENYKFLKSKNNFFELIYKTSYSLLFLFLISCLIVYFFLYNNFNWLIFIILFSAINAVLLILTKKNFKKLNLLISSIVLLLYFLFFRNYEIELFLLIICLIEFFLITFFSEYKLGKINLSNIIKDMRITYFFKKLFVNVVFSQLFKIIFIIFYINIFLFNNVRNFELILYLILLIELGDIFENLIKKSFWKTLSSNFQVQKDNKKHYQKIFRLTVFYFLIGSSIIYISNQYIFSSDFYVLFFFIIIFFSYNLEKVKNLILLTMDRNIDYKKHFTYNIINIIILSLIINSLYSLEHTIFVLKVLIFYLLIFELINLKIINKYISNFKN